MLSSFCGSWKIVDDHDETVENFLKKPVFLRGIAAKHNETGKIITGSAADFSQERSYVRALGELKERIVTVNKVKPHKIGKFSYSLSNGVASHYDLSIAKKNAFIELIERDVVLRSWYGELPKKIISESIDYFPFDFDIRVLEFPEVISHFGSIFTTGILASVPDENRFLFAFSSGSSRSLALEKAILEATQRYLFSPPESTPYTLSQIPSIEDHFEFYNRKQGFESLWEWSYDVLLDIPPVIYEDNSKFQILFSENTTSEKFFVVRAIDPELWPLTFGISHPRVHSKKINSKRLLHPFA